MTGSTGTLVELGQDIIKGAVYLEKRRLCPLNWLCFVGKKNKFRFMYQ